MGDPAAEKKWRQPAERRAARKRAAAAADGLIARLSRELAEARAAAGAWAEPVVRARFLAAAPAMADLCGGRAVQPEARLRRNVAMHAAVLPQQGAPTRAWRQAQKGPRLGASVSPKPDGEQRTHEVLHEDGESPDRAADEYTALPGPIAPDDELLQCGTAAAAVHLQQEAAEQQQPQQEAVEEAVITDEAEKLRQLQRAAEQGAWHGGFAARRARRSRPRCPRMQLRLRLSCILLRAWKLRTFSPSGGSQCGYRVGAQIEGTELSLVQVKSQRRERPRKPCGERGSKRAGTGSVTWSEGTSMASTGNCGRQEAFRA